MWLRLARIYSCLYTICSSPPPRVVSIFLNTRVAFSDLFLICFSLDIYYDQGEKIKLKTIFSEYKEIREIVARLNITTFGTEVSRLIFTLQDLMLDVTSCKSIFRPRKCPCEGIPKVSWVST